MGIGTLRLHRRRLAEARAAKQSAANAAPVAGDLAVEQQPAEGEQRQFIGNQDDRHRRTRR